MFYSVFSCTIYCRYLYLLCVYLLYFIYILILLFWTLLSHIVKKHRSLTCFGFLTFYSSMCTTPLKEEYPSISIIPFIIKYLHLHVAATPPNNMTFYDKLTLLVRIISCRIFFKCSSCTIYTKRVVCNADGIKIEFYAFKF